MSGKRGAWRLQLVESADKLRCSVVGFYGNERDEMDPPPPPGPHSPTPPGPQSPIPDVFMDDATSQDGADNEPEVVQELKNDDGEVVFSVTRYKLDREPYSMDVFVDWKNGYETHA
ncbi:hypothetical protein V5O48_019641, partial [Marasmius crinis-equi]